MAGLAAIAVTLGAASAEARALKSFVLPEAVHQMDEADVPRAAPRPRVRAAPLGLPPGFWTAERKAAVQRQVERFLAERDAGEDERATIAAEARRVFLVSPPGMPLPPPGHLAFERRIERFLAERERAEPEAEIAAAFGVDGAEPAIAFSAPELEGEAERPDGAAAGNTIAVRNLVRPD